MKTLISGGRADQPRGQKIIVKRRHRGHTFGMKTAISLPDDLFLAAERQAKRTRKSRSQLYAEALAKVRLYLRLANRLGWLSAGQYGHAAELVAEVGRLLGGWQKASHA